MSYGNNQVFGNDVNVLDTAQLYPLGTTRTVLGSQSNKGDQVWRYVRNAGAAAWTEGQIVLAVAATAQNLGTGQTATATASLARNRILGVAQTYVTSAGVTSTFSVGSYGWILMLGEGSILNDSAGTLAADTSFASSSAVAGSVEAAANSGIGANATIGVTHVSIAASTVGSAYIVCRP
jgi:hypothetical protein